MKVSIVIPAFNAAATIADTLRSVSAQTHADWEAIVVNDGSTDATEAIARELAGNESRIRVITQPNGGEAAARNAGLAAAHYDWLLFLDADDWIAPAHLATMTGALAADSSLDAVLCRHARVAADGTEFIEPYQPPPGDLFPVLARRAAFAVHACIVRTCLVKEVGGFDPTLKTSPDWDLWQRVARTGARFGIVRDVLAFYRMSEGSASLDGVQLLKDDLRVLRRGHAPDPRVPRPHPDHVNGLDEPLQVQEFYLLSWCAGLEIGAGRDPSPLFDIIGHDQFPDLYPPATAQCVFESAPLPTRRTTAGWHTMWPELAPKVQEFFAALEAHSSAHGLASRAMASLKRMVLTTSPSWDVIRDVLDDQEQSLATERQSWADASAGYESALQELRDLASRWEADAHARAGERDEATRLASAQEVRAERLQDEVSAVERDRDHWRQAAAEREAEVDALRRTLQTLEDDLARRDDQVGRLTMAVAEVTGDRDRTRADLDERTIERDSLEASNRHVELKRGALANELSERTNERDSLTRQLAERTAERDALQHSLERKLGDLLLNRWRLRKPALWAASLQSSLAQRASAARLAAEGRAPRHGRTRVVATACDVFPIYSQTFVYQEQTQLLKHGFDVRFIYSKLDGRDRLATPFAPLWDVKRQLVLNDDTHRRDYESYKRRMPDKITSLIAKLSEASGMSAADVEHHGNFLQAFTFTRMVEAYRPDYLHSYFFYDRSLMALIAAFLLDLPRGVSCYADHVLQDYELKVVPLHMELCDIVIATSERIKSELLAIAPAMNANKILVKPNGVDTSRFMVTERHEPEQGQPFRLVTVCRIEPKKGLLDLVDAVALLRARGVNVEAHIVGAADEWSQASRDYKAALDARISERDLWGKVHLEGRHGFEGITRFLALAHLFVAPFVETATGDKDGIPTALLEGMATGLPTIGTDAGSIAEVIDAHSGCVVRQRNPADLADAIARLVSDVETRTAMGKAAAARVRERFDAEHLEGLFHERIREVMRVRKAAAGV